MKSGDVNLECLDELSMPNLSLRVQVVCRGGVEHRTRTPPPNPPPLHTHIVYSLITLFLAKRGQVTWLKIM